MRAEGIRQFSKSDLVKVTELATRKQYTAEQTLVRVLRRFWTVVAAAAVLAFVAGAASAWWALQ